MFAAPSFRYVAVAVLENSKMSASANSMVVSEPAVVTLVEDAEMQVSL